jgi:hypothetical protein
LKLIFLLIFFSSAQEMALAIYVAECTRFPAPSPLFHGAKLATSALRTNLAKGFHDPKVGLMSKMCYKKVSLFGIF